MMFGCQPAMGCGDCCGTGMENYGYEEDLDAGDYYDEDAEIAPAQKDDAPAPAPAPELLESPAPEAKSDSST